MTEKQVGFLCQAVSSLPVIGSNSSLNLLRSYYLMRCKEVTKGYGLPVKYFSSKARCSHCGLEWDKQTVVKNAAKLSKRQRKRIRSLKSTNKNKDYVDSRKELLNNKQLIQLCSFCKHCTTNIIEKLKTKKKSDTDEVIKVNSLNNSTASIKTSVKNKKLETGTPSTAEIFTNIYSSAKDVFSLQNKSNTLKSSQKTPAKIIKNNKRKKDKFAGLWSTGSFNITQN